MEKQRKGFTIIELLVTIAILAILVLIGTPRLVGYLEKAELVRIQHDVKVMEQEMMTTMLEKEINGWQNNQKSLGSLIMKRQLYEKEGYAKKVDTRHLFIDGLKYQLASQSLNNDELSSNLGLGGDLIPIDSGELGVGGNLVTAEEFSVDKTYKVIPQEYSKKINTKLPGTFYTNSIGKVYYEHDKPLTIDEKEELTCPSPLPDYDFQLINGKGTIVKWHGTALHLVIPPYFLLEVDDEEQCVPVQVIGTGAFQNGGFKSIDIPGTVEDIQDDAFADNDLENVDIPPSVDKIGNGAFENNDIDKVEIPHSVDSIGDNAFAGNDNLKEPIIKNKPENVDVGNNAFGPEEPTYENPTPEDVGVIFIPGKDREGNKTGSIVASDIGDNQTSIEIPDEIEVGGELYPVTEIKEGVYQGDGLISVELPFTLERIEDYAFAGNQLEGVDIPHSVVYIGHYAFAFNEKVHSSNGDIKGTIGFIKIYDQEQVHKLNENGDIEENGTKVLSISNMSGKSIELKDYIFVTSLNDYVIDDEFVGDNDNSNSNPDDGNSDDNSIPGEDVDPDPEPEQNPEPEPDLGPGYTQEQIDELVKGEDKYVPVATAEELQHIASNSSTPRTFGQGTKWEDEYVGKLDSKFIQVKNIDFDLSSIDNFDPIGDNSTKDNNSRFTGTYNGGNYKITGLAINKPTTNYVGLFGYVDGSNNSDSPTIKNVGLKDVNIVGGHSTGGLVGYNYNSTISNSYVTGSVKGLNQTGGLVGYNRDSSTIRNSCATGNVTGTGNNIGGLVGFNANSTIDNSYATGDVTGTGSKTGGLAGQNASSTIDNSYATGDVTGIEYTGGLAGFNFGSSTMSNLYATGSVTGGEYTGGLVGYTQKPIENSYAIGDVTGVKNTGGLVGGNYYYSTIINSHATGSVAGEENTGGLVGSNHGLSTGIDATNSKSTIEDSYATGSVTGTGNNTGGLVGNNFYATIKDSYATGSVTNSGSYTGGLVGYSSSGSRNTNSTISNSYATGSVTGTNYTGGLVGENIRTTITNSYATGNDVTGAEHTGGLVGSNSSTSAIRSSYATGSVDGTNYTGGLVGRNSNGIIRYSYYDKETTGMSDTGKGIPKETSEMKTESTFYDWNFTGIWEITPDNYPTLR